MITVFVNGCFDILHKGHILLFEYAKSLGDKLIVAIDSDENVKKAKGSSRPFNNLNDRMLVLKSIRYIDTVLSFNDSFELENLVKFISPDIMIVGSDWKNKKVIGSEYAKQVRFFDRIGDYSTSKILESKRF